MPRNEAEAGEINAGCILLAHSPFVKFSIKPQPISGSEVLGSRGMDFPCSKLHMGTYFSEKL
jgi:hypothetical protein